MIEYPMQIGGELRRSDTRETIASPYDGSSVGEVHVGGEEDMEDAISAATRAFERMRVKPTHERAGILTRIARTVEERREDFAQLMMREGGKPIRFVRGEVDRA